MNPYLLSLFLLAIVGGIVKFEKVPSAQKLLHYLPGAFWCYFIPMLLSTVGILPENSPVYSFLSTYVLSGCLILLLLNINLPAIFRLGKVSLTAMTVGALGIAIGAVQAYALFGRWLPPETWKGVGALSASWIGGSANMLAVKEGLNTPDSVFAPMVIVDTAITYSWMGILVGLVSFQERWDKWVGADMRDLEDVNRRLSASHQNILPSQGEVMTDPLLSVSPPPLWGRIKVGGMTKVFHALWMIGASMGIGALCLLLGEKLPPLGAALTPSGWAFLLTTLIGILLSLTPASKLEKYGASKWGYLCLYLLLASMGAKARLQYILKAPLLIVFACFWVSIHALLLILYGYFFKVPMFFLVTSSQANIGGTASTPIVAGVYQPRLAPLGLLLAISGNVVGTYCGILIAEACRWAVH